MRTNARGENEVFNRWLEGGDYPDPTLDVEAAVRGESVPVHEPRKLGHRLLAVTAEKRRENPPVEEDPKNYVIDYGFAD